MKSSFAFYTLLSCSLLFISCKKEEEATTTSTSDKPKEIIMPRVQAIPSQGYTQQAAPQPVQTQQASQPVTQTITPNQAVVTKPGMNPPHGQPGHRCDIAVGAPLNSPVKVQTQTTKAGTGITQQITPNAVTTQTSQPSGAPALLTPNSGTATTTTAPGMNPPHGQDGHRCDIAVGAPLPKS